MRRDLLLILCCPACKGDLSVSVAKEEAGDIVTGSLTCAGCAASYSIEDSIPNLIAAKR